MSDTCTTCDDPILFATTTDGESMPVDAEPHERGNVLLTRQGGKLKAGVLGPGKAAGARAAGYKLHRSHFATCPHANVHRRAR